MEAVVLKPGREKSVRGRHPWIFSGAIASMPHVEDGSCVEIHASTGDFLAIGYLNRQSQITVRILSWEKRSIDEILHSALQRAITLRKKLFSSENTNAYRLVFAEADFLPGLIVDQYADTLVVQIGTLGMEKLKSKIVKLLVEYLQPSWIYEKSDLPSRKEEKLPPFEGTLFGVERDQVIFQESGFSFCTHIKTAQKTGFFLDQRMMRKLVQGMSAQKKVLNCFSYSGAFSVYALAGGASLCDSVDISDAAVQMIQKNLELNSLHETVHREYTEDVFSFLRRKDLEYDFIILDPPAFAKRKHDVKQAARGYKEINRLAMQAVPKGSFLLTCSCSYHIDTDLFRKILFSAALDAKRDVRILQYHRLAYDHPESVYFPEGNYLKSFLCYLG
jgi:23S rRNA (cytosine1962-C5)-methyltransferase